MRRQLMINAIKLGGMLSREAGGSKELVPESGAELWHNDQLRPHRIKHSTDVREHRGFRETLLSGMLQPETEGKSSEICALAGDRAALHIADFLLQRTL